MLKSRVLSSALNFKDLLKVQGRLPDDVTAHTFFGNSLGMEVSGVVVQVGEGITHIKIGDAVITPVANAFCSYATVPATYVIPKPNALSFEQAPVMIGYLTAYRALVDLAQVQAGEKVLIHNATGGVGLAAIQVAKWRQAEIYATAGTDDKRQYLNDIGIQHIYDSRSLLFAEQIKQDTQDYGVDVILNAIAGDAIYKGFNLLAPYGRFIEIGKKDITENTSLNMQAFNRNLIFASIDIDRMLVERTSHIQQLLRAILERFCAGDFEPFPIKRFKASQIQEAFGLMAKSQHIGKIVLDFNDDIVDAYPCEQRPLFDNQSSYLVTGGTKGFGLAVGQWLAENGAGQVVLVSRSGPSQLELQTKESQQRIVSMTVDVTDLESVRRVIEIIEESGFPLKGIFHSAMVLDDGLLVDMTKERFQRVLAPKIDGVLNLQEATKAMPLDYFVNFSSISSIIGNMGQANYVVANSFLDSFSHYRRRLGLPAMTINWGVLTETGIVARHGEIAKILEQAGITGFSNAKALAILGKLLRVQPIEVGVFNVNWQKWRFNFPKFAKTAFISDLLKETSVAGNPNDQHEKMLKLLLPFSVEERQEIVIERLSKIIGKFLNIEPRKININISLNNLGVDSLMAAELAVMLTRELGIEFSTFDLSKDLSIIRLADIALERLIKEEDELIANLEELSEEEIDQLLAT